MQKNFIYCGLMLKRLESTLLFRDVAVRHSEKVNLFITCEVCSIDRRVDINQR